MIVCKTDAPMARVQESPKAKFLKIRPFRTIQGTRENDFIQNRASSGKGLGVAEGEILQIRQLKT